MPRVITTVEDDPRYCDVCRFGAVGQCDERCELDDGHDCACGQRMHANDSECRDCWRARVYPDA